MFYIGDDRGKNFNAITTFMSALKSEWEFMRATWMLFLQAPQLMTAAPSSPNPKLRILPSVDSLADVPLSKMSSDDRVKLIGIYEKKFTETAKDETEENKQSSTIEQKLNELAETEEYKKAKAPGLSGLTTLPEFENE